MKILRLSHVCLDASSLERNRQFYKDILHLEDAHQFLTDAGDMYGNFLHAGAGTFVEFFKNERLKPGLILRHICFEVDDIEAWAIYLRGNGYSIEEMKRGRTDRVLQFFVTAPDGLRIEFQQHDEHSKLRRFVHGEGSTDLATILCGD